MTFFARREDNYCIVDSRDSFIQVRSLIMKTSQTGLTFISKWEGIVLKPYRDIAGLRTVGVGHLILPNEDFPDGVQITKERAFEILAQDVHKCEVAIEKNIPVTLNQNQFDALVSFGFNCGVGVYAKSGVADALRAKEYSRVPDQLLPWCKARIGGVLKVVPGLLARRRSEGTLFSTSVGEKIPVVAWTVATLETTQKTLKSLGMYELDEFGSWNDSTRRAVNEFVDLYGIMLQSEPSEGLPQHVLDAIETIAENSKKTQP